MRLYQFNLPTHTNAARNTESARKSWSLEALNKAGGYTEQPRARGLWRGEDRDYDEGVIAYQVACLPAVAQELLDAAFLFYPDQEAIFVADLGPVRIVTRAEHEGRAG